MTTGSSKWIRRSRRLAIYERDRWRCVWCTRDVDLPRRRGDGAVTHMDHVATLDHVRPRDEGGSNKSENLVTACAKCNAARRHLSAYDFARLLVGPTFGDSIGTILARVIAAITRPLPGRKLDGRAAAGTKRHVTRSPAVSRATSRASKSRS